MSRFLGQVNSLSRRRPTQPRQQPLGLHRNLEFLEQRLVLTPTSDEQLFVYLLNKIRHDPQAYDDQANLGGILDSVSARQPLAVNDDLFASARFHATEMANNNYFGHQSAVTGDWPNKMARDQGYSLPDYFTSNNNYIESIAAGNLYGNAADVIKLLIIDQGVPSLGHRNHLLGIDTFNAQANEIGVGHGFNLSSFYDHYWAAHITFSDPDNVFLTGVVYQDSNSDQAFSLNEGLAGVTVRINGTTLQTVTNAAGGWSIQVPATGTYTVLVNGGTFVGTASATAQVTGANRELDFISGQTTGTVDFTAAHPSTNLAPVNTLPAGPLSGIEDVAISVTGISIADADAATNAVQVTLSALHGNLSVATNIAGGVSTEQVSGNNSNQVVLTAPLAKINATLGNSTGLTYKGLLNYNGTDTLTVLTNDQGNTGTGGPKIDSDSVEITLAAVNDPPVNTVPSAATTSITGVGTSITGISIQDSDLGSEDAQVTLTVLHGTITLRTDVVGGLTAADVSNNGTGSVTISAPLSLINATFVSSAGVSYLNSLNYLGADTLTVLTSDQGHSGTGSVGTDQDSVGIQVVPVPTPPVLSIPGTTLTSKKGAAVIVGSGGTITDADSTNFQGGKLVIQVTAGAKSTDILSLQNVGTKTGQLNLSGTNVRLGKTVIGNLSGGKGSSALTIQFTTSVTLSTVQTVLQNVKIKAQSGKLAKGLRTVTFTATDPGHNASTPVTRQVSVP